MGEHPHEKSQSTYRGIPDALAHAIRALLSALPHVDDDKIDLVFRVLEDRGDETLIRIEEDERLLSLNALCNELGKSRTTIWRRFKEDPRLQEKLLSGYKDGQPQYSSAKVRRYKAGLLN